MYKWQQVIAIVSLSKGHKASSATIYHLMQEKLTISKRRDRSLCPLTTVLELYAAYTCLENPFSWLVSLHVSSPLLLLFLFHFCSLISYIGPSRPVLVTHVNYSIVILKRGALGPLPPPPYSPLHTCAARSQRAPALAPSPFWICACAL